MRRLAGFMKGVDDFFFKQVDQIRSTSAFRQIVSSVASLDNTGQKIINHIASLVVVLTPIILVVILFSLNTTLKEKVNTKEEIYSYINKLNTSKNNVSSFSKQLVSPQDMSTQQIFSSALTSSISAKRIDTTKIKVKDFKQDKEIVTFKKYSATISFSKLSIDDFSNLINSLVNKMKVVVTFADIKKDSKDRTLNGTLKVIHFSNVK